MLVRIALEAPATVRKSMDGNFIKIPPVKYCFFYWEQRAHLGGRRASRLVFPPSRSFSRPYMGKGGAVALGLTKIPAFCPHPAKRRKKESRPCGQPPGSTLSCFPPYSMNGNRFAGFPMRPVTPFSGLFPIYMTLTRTQVYFVRETFLQFYTRLHFCSCYFRTFVRAEPAAKFPHFHLCKCFSEILHFLPLCFRGEALPVSR